MKAKRSKNPNDDWLYGLFYNGHLMKSGEFGDKKIFRTLTAAKHSISMMPDGYENFDKSKIVCYKFVKERVVDLEIEKDKLYEV